jgi:hypothetical protein
MKALFVVVAIVLVLVVAGWLTISRSGGKPAVILETERIEADAERAAEKGRELLHETTEKVEELREENAAEDRAEDVETRIGEDATNNSRKP